MRIDVFKSESDWRWPGWPKFGSYTAAVLTIAVVQLFFSRPSAAQDEIPATKFEAIAWLKKERNTIKLNDDGEVQEIVIDYVPDVFAVGDLAIFPKLEVLKINYTGRFYDRHMSGIAKLKNLKTFSVDYCDEISEASLAVLYYLPKLEELKLQNCSNIYSLDSLANCEQLKKLDLSQNDHFEFKALEALVRLPNLESIALGSNTNLEDEHLKLLGRIKSLTEIDLKHCTALTDEGLESLKDLKLKTLDLYGCESINGSGLVHLQPDSVEELVLAATAVDDEQLQRIGRFKNLKKLMLYKNSEFVKGPGLSVLGNFKKLETLNLRGLAVTNEQLATMDGITTLEKLTLANCEKVSGQGLAHLTKSKNLETLLINGARRFDSQEDFDQVAKFTALRKLNISATRIRPEAIDALLSLQKLEELDLSECKWVDDEAIAKLSKLKSLKKITLNKLGRLTDQAFHELAKMSNLESVEIHDNRNLTGEGLAAFESDSKLGLLDFNSLPKLTPAGLSNLAGLENLKELTILGKPLTNEQVIALKGIPNLRELNIDVTDVNENVYENLKASLPKLEQ